MKLKTEDIDSLDLCGESDEAFWQSLRDLMRYGIPAYDGKGHYVDLRIKVRPLQIDMISAIREKCPEGWYKSQAALCRSIIAIGCKVFLRMFNQEDSKWADVLNGLNKIAKQQRLDEFKREVELIKDSIVKGALPPQEKLKLIDNVARLENAFLQM